MRFVHPLYAAAVYERASEDARRDVHLRLSRVVRGLEERARHLALATETPDERVASVVEAAATAASSRGSPAAAAELIAHARRLTPPGEDVSARRRTLAAVDYEFAAGDTARASALLDEALADRAGRPAPRAPALSAGAACGTSPTTSARAPTSSTPRSRTPARTPRSGPRSRRASRGGCCSLAATSAPRPEHASAAARWAERTGDRAALAAGAGRRRPDALRAGARVGTHDAPRARRSRQATAHLRVLAQPSFAYGYCLSCVDEIDRARAVFEELRRRASEQGDEGAMPSILNHLALLECLAGDWDAAARLADEAHALALEGGHRPTQASTLAKRAMVAARRGDVDIARDAAERALALAGGPEEALARGGETAIWTLGFLELSLGDPEAADRHLRPLVDALLAAGVRVPVRCAACPTRSRPWPRSAGRMRPRRSARPGAAVASCSRRAATTRRHWRRSNRPREETELPFEHARTLLALGTEQRRARQRRAARATLEAAQASFDALGASLWSAKARTELGRIGGRAPSTGELTPAERRVAELVAAGRTNREVAETLVLSVHTVEAALTQAYRKLGVRSRTELARLYR